MLDSEKPRDKEYEEAGGTRQKLPGSCMQVPAHDKGNLEKLQGYELSSCYHPKIMTSRLRSNPT